MSDGAADPRLARREARVAGILVEAWRLAERDGLAGISLRDLADRVELRQPSLYVYFASKLDLYDAMFADGYRQLLAFLAERPSPADPRAAVEQLTTDLVRFASDHLVLHQLLFQRTIPGFEPSPASWAIALEFYRLAQATLARTGVEHQDDVDLFTALIAGLSDQQIANDPGGERWVRQAPRVVRMFLADTAAQHRP